MSDLTVAIMAGGKSSRMGTDKSFVPLLGQPMIEHILSRLAALVHHHTVLITNQPDSYGHLGLPMFVDVLPNNGSLGGIYTALHYSSTAYTLVIACDMPFINVDLLRYMIDLCSDYDVIVPRKDGYPQGLHAIYSARCQAPIRARIEAIRLKVIGFYEDVHVRYLDPPEWEKIDPRGLSFYNINTPEELQAAQQIANT